MEGYLGTRVDDCISQLSLYCYSEHGRVVKSESVPFDNT